MAERETPAETQRRAWRRHGKTTRLEYDKTPSALSRELQDEIVRRHRSGQPRSQIRREMPNVTEYALKRVLRVLAYDPQAFQEQLDGDIRCWKSS